jgi:hypothetical protein
MARTLLTADTTYYVRTDGNDANNGSANNSANAFLTPQGAYDYLLANVDAAGYFIKIKMASGTYTSSSHRRSTDEYSADTTVLTLNALVPGASCVEFEGDLTTPTNVVWDQTTADATAVYIAAAGGLFRFEGIAMRATGGGNASAFFQNTPAIMSWSKMDFGTFGAYHYHGGCGSVLKCFGDYTISGGAKCHVWMEGFECWDNESHTVTLTGTPNFTTAFVQADRNSMIFEYDVTYTGAATGVRYRFNDYGSIVHGADYDDLDDLWPGDTNGIITHRTGGVNPTLVLDSEGAGGTTTPQFNISGRDDTSALAVSRFSNDAFGPQIVLLKSRSTSRISTNSGTVPTSGDELGRICWQGKDSTQAAIGAAIRAVCTGSAASNDMPSALEFGTTPDGSGGTDTTFSWKLDSTGMWQPKTNDTYDIGTSSLGVRKLYVGSGGSGLDFYKTGSWTPIMMFNGTSTGVTYSTQVGSYTRIGNMVTLWGTIVLTNNGSGTGVAQIGSLPYNVVTSTGYQAIGTLGNIANITLPAGGWGGPFTYLESADQRIDLKTLEGDGTETWFSDTDIGNTAEFSFTITYRCA